MNSGPEGGADQRWTRIWAVFEGALELPDEQRDAFIARELDDDGMRSEVRALIAGHETEGGILDRPVPVPDDTPRAEGVGDVEMERRVKRVFSDAYGLVRELGRGGMSRVYLAWEKKHQRRVVLKVLHPEVAASHGSVRFEREATLIAQLSHPNIVPLIDSGVREEFAYYVMPYIDALTLRNRIDRGWDDGMPLPRILAVLRDVAAALDFAHLAGVVHRDLKPDNVLLAGPHTYLFDFGIAKASHADTDPGRRLTRDGAFLGTPGYAAPEQVWGGGPLDKRADLWAWGVMAWELLTGRLPTGAHEGEGPDDAVEALRAAAPGLPPAVAEVIVQCLSLDPARRPEDAAELLDALGARDAPPAPAAPLEGRGRLAGASAGGRAGGVPWLPVSSVAVLALIAWVAFGRPSADGGASDAPTLGLPVAVAPLVDETTGADAAVLGRFAGDWITQGIQEVESVQVVPWPVSLATARAAESADDLVRVMADGTGARTVVVGSVYEFGGRLQFRVEVTDAASGRIVSAPEPVSAAPDSAEAALQELVDRIRSSVAIASDPRLSAIQGLARRPPTFEAYVAFDRGVDRYLSQDYGGASDAFLDAFARDSTFYSALVYGALTLENSGQSQRADSVIEVVAPHAASLSTIERARWEAVRATLTGDAPQAYLAQKRLAEIGPGTRAPYNVARLALSMNRPNDALEALLGADPDRGELRGWAQYWTVLAHAHHLVGDYEAEAEAAAEMGRRYPERRIALVLEVRARAAQGDLDEVDRLLDLSETMSPDTYWSAGAAAVVGAEALRARGYEGWEELARRAQAWLDTQLTLQPETRHLYWRASADFALRRWDDARDRFADLRERVPTSATYRGMYALAAAHAGDLEAAEDALAAPFESDEGAYSAYRARLAALQGDADAATTLLGRAFAQGLGGWAWVPEAGFDDFAPVFGDPRIVRLLSPDEA